MRSRRFEIIAVAALALAAATFALILQGRLTAYASPDAPDAPLAIANTLNYQGILRDEQGALVTGARDMTFKIYNDPVLTAPANLLFTQTVSNVAVRDGLFTVVLGDPTPIGPAVFADGPRFIGITVAPDTQEMAPRQRLHPVPWAQQATLALTSNTLVANATIPSATVSGNLNVTGNLGVGTAPAYQLDVNNRIRLRQQEGQTGGNWSAGLWLYQRGPAADRAFIGMSDDTNVGFWGNTGAGWKFLMNTTTGNVGIGGAAHPDANYKLYVTGKVAATSGYWGTCVNDAWNHGVVGWNLDVTCNQDVAETFATTEQTEAGDLVVLTPPSGSRRMRGDGGVGGSQPAVRLSRSAYDGGLVGVVSTNPGLIFDQGRTYLSGDNTNLITADKTVVAMIGRVPVKFSLENGPIAVGDPLTSSSTPGLAMKATQAGQIIGYALHSSDEAVDGKLLAWLQLGHYLPPQLMASLNDGATSAQTVAALKERNAALEQQVATLDARLATLERSSSAASLPTPWLGLAGLAAIGLVFGVGLRRAGQPGDRRERR